jgi:hypothetical protein
MTTDRDRGAPRAATLAVGPLAAGPTGRLARLSRRFYLIDRTDYGVTRRDLSGLLVAAGRYPGLRPACTVTPYREDRCLLMPRYAQPGRS